MKSPKLQYDDPKKKLRPHILVMEGAPSSFKPEVAAPAAAVAAPKLDKPVTAPAPVPAAAPAAEKPAKAKKPKAAHNDDPS